MCSMRDPCLLGINSQGYKLRSAICHHKDFTIEGQQVKKQLISSMSTLDICALTCTSVMTAVHVWKQLEPPAAVGLIL